jgi:hypothetical protein
VYRWFSKQLIHQDRCLIVYELSEKINLSHRSCQGILSENLNMQRISAKFSPHLVTDEQKRNQFCVVISNKKFKMTYISCQRSLHALKSGFMDTFWKKSSHCYNRHSQKAKQVQLHVRNMLIVPLTAVGLCITNSQQYYTHVTASTGKCPEKWQN